MDNIAHFPDGNDPLKSVRFPDRSCLVRSETIPWTPWALPGSWFKLLYVNRAISLSLTLLKVDKGTQLPDHYHFGEAHAFILQGDFGYEHGRAWKGDLFVEGGGISHMPTISEGEDLILYAAFFGGLGHVDADGKVVGCVSCDEMYEMAHANGAADHLEPPPPKRY